MKFAARFLALTGLSAVLAACGDDGESTGASGDVPTALASTTAGVSAHIGFIDRPPSQPGLAKNGTNSSAPPVAPDSITLAWAAPTENTDGSALTNLSGYEIRYGRSASAMTQTISINTVGLLRYVVDDLRPGTWYFEVVAVNSLGVPSDPSGIVTYTI